MTSYLLSASVCTLIAGRLGDRHCKYRLLFATLVTGRRMPDLPLAFGIVRDESPPEKVPGAIRLTASLAAVGGGLGIVLAGPLTDALGIRSLFWIAAIVALLAAIWRPRPALRAPTTSLSPRRRALRRRSVHAFYGNLIGNPTLKPTDLPASIKLTYPVVFDHVPAPVRLPRHAGGVFDLVAAGKLTPRIGARYPLADAPKAHADLASRRTVGKLLLLP